MKSLYCKWLSKVSEASIQYNTTNRAFPAPRKPPASLHHAVGSHLFTGKAETSSIPPVEQHIPPNSRPASIPYLGPSASLHSPRLLTLLD